MIGSDMKHPSLREQTSFLWQALLILLPVFVLAAVGLYSLRQDRLLAEQDARQRAGQTLREIAIGLKTFHGSAPENDFPNHATFTASGQLEHPPDYSIVPDPPAWINQLSAVQWRAWQRAKIVAPRESSDAAMQAAYRAFLETNPGREAAVNARFALLSLDVTSNSPSNAVAHLLRFALEDALISDRNRPAHPIAAESGLPLSALAIAQALRTANLRELTEPLFEGLRSQVFGIPSALTARLLDEAKPLADSSAPPMRAAFLALRQSWKGQERLRQLARQVQPLMTGRPITTNVWIESSGRKWIAILNSDQDASTTNQHISARFFPKEVIERALQDALAETKIDLPQYLSLNIEAAGEPMALPHALQTKATSDKPPALLASELSWLALSGDLPDLALIQNPQGRASPSPVSRTVNLSDPALVQNPPHEIPPTRVTIALRLYLSDPGLLYARQHQRTVWFALLITAAAAAAVVGCLASWRAFLRQQQLNEMKSNFVSSVSHELRAPIASVRLMAEGLERGKITTTEKQNEYFHFIVQECRRLSSLIENVLDFSRIEQGRKEYEFEATDLSALLQQTVKLMEPSASERQIQLALSLPTTPVSANVDGKALQQALVNLVDNAIKYSPIQSVVTVGLDSVPLANANTSAKNGHTTARLWVEDHGDGIPLADHSRIFERFYRRGSELRRETQGVGIGLSIVKHIVEAHGGRVVVRSATGQGSRFTIELPENPAAKIGK